MACCYVTAYDEKDPQTSSVLREDQFFDREADLCRVYSEDSLLLLERLLMRSGISYCVKEERMNPLVRLLGTRKHGMIVCVNEQNMEAAMEIADSVRGTEVIGELPEEDWSPAAAKERRDEEKAEAARFRRRHDESDSSGRNQYDYYDNRNREYDEYEQEEGNREYRRRRA